MLVLLGVFVVILGFATKRNALLVVAISGIVTAALAKESPNDILTSFGENFAASRSVTVFVITLPVIGLLERYGLREQGRVLISRLVKLTTGRLLALYLLIRQVTAALGLITIAGPAQTVRPLIAPMAEAAADRKYRVSDRMRERIRSLAASADNVGAFFGEDIFVAVGSILLITGFVNATYHTHLEPLKLALWAIPTAICALCIHGGRLLYLDRKLASDLPPADARTAKGTQAATGTPTDADTDTAADAAAAKAEETGK